MIRGICSYKRLHLFKRAIAASILNGAGAYRKRHKTPTAHAHAHPRPTRHFRVSAMAEKSASRLADAVLPTNVIEREGSLNQSRGVLLERSANNYVSSRLPFHCACNDASATGRSLKHLGKNDGMTRLYVRSLGRRMMSGGVGRCSRESAFSR